ncbi:MAG TPA: IS4 family transposase [Stellaceae bacterium]
MGGDRAGEVRISRFLRNRRVTPAAIFATAAAHTLPRVAGRHILALQDTTSLRDDGDKCNLQLHPEIVVDAADGALLGLVHAEFLRRNGEARPHSNKRALAEKDSQRWITATAKAESLIEAGAASVTVVADREGDIYEEFACRPPRVEVLIRAHHDRLLADGRRLYSCTEELADLGRETIDLPAIPGRAARQARIALRACPVEIKRPKRHSVALTTGLPPSVRLFLVEAYEVDPPAEAAPIHWRLLTTHTVASSADAKRITDFYRQRWTIEQLFRVMKTRGFNIEALRIGDAEPFENLAAATLIAAIAVLQMVRDRDGQAGRPATDIIDAAEAPALEAISKSLEGKTQKQKNPHRPGSLAFISWICARLGGWTGYYGKPGPIVLLNGHLQLKTMLKAWALLRDV